MRMSIYRANAFIISNQKARLKIPMDRIRKYFPQSYTAAQIEDAVVKLCERDYHRRTDRAR